MTLLIDGLVWRHYTHNTYWLTRIQLVGAAGLPHTATVTSLTAAAAPQPRRAAAVYVSVMAAAVLAWLASAWLWHDSRRAGEPIDAVFFVPPLVFFAVGQVSHWRQLLRHRPVAFQVHDGAFVAPPADQVTASTVVMQLAAGTMAASAFAWPRYADGPDGLITLGRVCVVLLAVMVPLSIAVFARGPGRILLRPEGLRITYAYGTRDVPWDAISAGPRRSGSMLEPKLRIGRPDLVRSTGLARRHPRTAFLPTMSTWIRREFLADAVNYYLATPLARPTIGTGEGYVHLRRVLRAG